MEKSEMVSKIIRIVIVAIILTGLVLTISLVWRPLLFWRLIPRLADNLVSATGMNVWLARALVIPVIFFLILAIGLMASLKGKKRMLGFALFCLVIFIGNMGMYLLTKGHLFEFETGKGKWYYTDPLTHEIRYYSTDGYDVLTGQPVKKLTPQKAKQIKAWKGRKQKVVKPIPKKIPPKLRPEPEKKIIKPSPEVKDKARAEPENRIIDSYIEAIDPYLRFDFIGFERAYCENCRFHIKRIADVVFRLNKFKSPDSVDVLMRLWERMYYVKGFYPEALEVVSTIPVLLASIGTPEALQFIEDYIHKIEAEAPSNKIVRNSQGILIKGKDFKIVRTKYPYHGEQVLIKVIDALEQHKNKPNSGQIKNLLTLIANRASSPKVRTYASSALAQY